MLKIQLSDSRLDGMRRTAQLFYNVLLAEAEDSFGQNQKSIAQAIALN